MHQMQFKALQEDAGKLQGGTSRGEPPDSLPAEWCADRLAKEETHEETDAAGKAALGFSWPLLAFAGFSWLLLVPPGFSWLLLAPPEETEADRALVKLFVDIPGPKQNRSSFCVIIHVYRHSEFYVWNVFVLLFLVTTSSALAYVIKPLEIGDRAAILTTILLATLAHKMIAVQWLPVKPYLTFLDKYVLLNFMVQFSSILVTCAILLVEYHCHHQKEQPERAWCDCCDYYNSMTNIL